jgi:hypothetical protein
MAKAPTARIVIVIAMILSLLIDASCSGRGSFIVLSSLVIGFEGVWLKALQPTRSRMPEHGG